MKESYSDIFHAVSHSEHSEIVLVYATIIVTIWNDFKEYAMRLNRLLDKGIISSSDHEHLIKQTFHKIKSRLSHLLIEQFYNTGDENLFDASLMMNEDVYLEEYSTINPDVLQGDSEREEPIRIFYNGIFLTLEKGRDNNRHHFRIIVRNEKEVKTINRKLNRSRQILEIDEVTLGKKYYDGLCQRSHFMR